MLRFFKNINAFKIKILIWTPKNQYASLIYIIIIT